MPKQLAVALQMEWVYGGRLPWALQLGLGEQAMIPAQGHGSPQP